MNKTNKRSKGDDLDPRHIHYCHESDKVAPKQRLPRLSTRDALDNMFCHLVTHLPALQPSELREPGQARRVQQRTGATHLRH